MPSNEAVRVENFPHTLEILPSDQDIYVSRGPYQAEPRPRDR